MGFKDPTKRMEVRNLNNIWFLSAIYPMRIHFLEPNVLLHLNTDSDKSFYLSRKTSYKHCFQATNDKFGNRESTWWGDGGYPSFFQ